MYTTGATLQLCGLCMFFGFLGGMLLSRLIFARTCEHARELAKRAYTLIDMYSNNTGACDVSNGLAAAQVEGGGAAATGLQLLKLTHGLLVSCFSHDRLQERNIHCRYREKWRVLRKFVDLRDYNTDDPKHWVGIRTSDDVPDGIRYMVDRLGEIRQTHGTIDPDETKIVSFDMREYAFRYLGDVPVVIDILDIGYTYKMPDGSTQYEPPTREFWDTEEI